MAHSHWVLRVFRCADDNGIRQAEEPSLEKGSNLCASATFEAPLLRGFLLSAGSDFKARWVGKKEEFRNPFETAPMPDLPWHSIPMKLTSAVNPGSYLGARAELSRGEGICLSEISRQDGRIQDVQSVDDRSVAR